MKMTYQSYCADMQKFKQSAMSEEAFNEMQGISEIQEPLIIQPKKDHRKAAASLDNFIKIAESSKRRRSVARIQEAQPKKPRAVQPPMTPQQHKEKYIIKAKENLAKGLTTRGTVRKPRPVGMGEEELKKMRSKWTKEKRIEWKAQGLTSRGLPFKIKGEKPTPTTKETRSKRCEYAKTYREKNREKHLEYRREYRRKQIVQESRNNTSILEKVS